MSKQRFQKSISDRESIKLELEHSFDGSSKKTSQETEEYSDAERQKELDLRRLQMEKVESGEADNYHEANKVIVAEYRKKLFELRHHDKTSELEFLGTIPSSLQEELVSQLMKDDQYELGRLIDKLHGVDRDKLIMESIEAHKWLLIGAYLDYSQEGIHDKKMAEKIIEFGGKHVVAEHIDKFHEADHKQIAEKIIGKWGGAEEVAEYINKFKGLDQEIIEELIKAEQLYRIVDSLKGIQGLDYNKLMTEAINSGNYDAMFRNLDKFPGVDHKQIVEQMFENGKGKDLLIYPYIDKLQGIDYNKIATKLIEAGECGIVAKHIDKLQGIDQAILKSIEVEEDSFKKLMEADGDQYPEILRSIPKSYHKQLAFRLVNNHRVLPVMESLEHFHDFDSKKIASTICNDRYKKYEIVRYLDKFPEFDKETAIWLMYYGNQIDYVIDNLDKFSEFNYEDLTESLIDNKKWDILIKVASRFSECQSTYQDFLSKQKDIAKNIELPFPERQKAFDVLTKLIKNGEASISQEFSEIISQRSRQKEVPESKWGLDPSQEAAFNTLIRLDNPDSNEALFSLLDNDNVSTAIKYEVMKKLIRKDRGFFDEKTKVILKEWLYTKSPRDLDWQDLRFVKSVLNNIPSTELRNKSKKHIHVAMEHFNKSQQSINQEWQEKYSKIPENTFLQVWELAQGDEELLNKFQALYTSIRKESTAKDNLLYGIVNSLGINPEVLNLLVKKLKEIDFGSKEDAKELSGSFRKIVFLDIISKIRERDEYGYYDYESGDDYYYDDKEESKADPEIRQIFLRETSTPRELSDFLEDVASRKIQKILPHENITAEKIEKIEEKWGDLEPILTYVSRYPGLKKYIAEMAVNFDNDEDWKNWRYDLENETVARQIGHLSEEQLQIWQADYFAEMGDIIVAEGSTDKAQKVKNVLREAVMTDKHIYNPERGQDKNKFIQETLEKVYVKIEQEPDKQSEIIKNEIENIQNDTQQIDSVIQLSEVPKIKQNLEKVFVQGKNLTLSSKTKNCINYLSNFLPKEIKQSLANNYHKVGEEKKPVSADNIITSEIRQALVQAIKEIEDKAKDLDKLDIWDKYNLDKTNLKNLGQFYQKRQELQATIDLLRLNNLSNKLIAINRIVEKEGKKGGQTLLNTIDNLKKYFKNSPLLQDINNVEFGLKEKQEAMGKKRLAMIFTDDPQVLWQVGKYPLGCGSCQHYAEGSYANNLMGYVGDANCKVAYLVDLNKLPREWQDRLDEHEFDEIKNDIPMQELLNASLGRTIAKMAEKDNKPVVLLEPTYTVNYKGDTSKDKYFNMFVDLMVVEPMNAKMARGGGKKSVNVGSSRSSQGQYEDLDLSSVKFITKESKPTKEDQEIAERIRSSGFERAGKAA